jgi:hypothetical protein
MARYRKKPVEIEAWRFAGSWASAYEIINQDASMVWQSGDDDQGLVFINTLEGQMRADPGDWIIRGVQGEFYPCKPDIFEATYEPA